MGDCYLEVMSQVQGLHWKFLQLIKLELERLSVTDINAVQCVRLFNMHDVETTITAMNLRGCNVAYNISKMVGAGYLTREYQARDRRCAVIKLTDKARSLRAQLSHIHQRHAQSLTQTLITDSDLEAALITLRNLERFLATGGPGQSERLLPSGSAGVHEHVDHPERRQAVEA